MAGKKHDTRKPTPTPTPATPPKPERITKQVLERKPEICQHCGAVNSFRKRNHHPTPTAIYCHARCKQCQRGAIIIELLPVQSPAGLPKTSGQILAQAPVTK